MGSKIWTDSKIKYLKDNYNTKQSKELSKILGVSYSTLIAKVRKLGLPDKRKLGLSKGKQAKHRKPYIAYVINYKDAIQLEKIPEYKNNFHIGQKIKIQNKTARGSETVRGVVIYKTDYFITLLIKGAYKESYKYIDFIVGDIILLN